MADVGDATGGSGGPGLREVRSELVAHSRERAVVETLEELRALCAELRALALEPSASRFDMALILEAARRIDRVAAEALRAAGVEAEASPAGPPPTRVQPSRPRVLVVDDDTDLRASVAFVLERGYEVLTAANGEECLEKARVDRPDVILMDLFMPGLDGLDALEQLHGDPITQEIPVILVSARADEALRVRGLDLGAVDFLAKPFSEQELRARLDRTLRLVRSHTLLRQLAATDPLTGLANLRAFRERLDEEVKRARRYRTPLTCVMADVDRLKAINDEYGHSAGDLAIGAVARVIHDELRETDFGARYGGDEFVLLLPHTTGEEGRVFAERLCARLHATPLAVAGRLVQLGSSFGVAELGEGNGEEAGAELVRAADAALYDAKHAGRGRVAVAHKLS